MDARLQRALSSKLLVESASGKYFLVTCSFSSSTSTLFAVQNRALLAALRMQVARKAGSIASIGQIVHDHQSKSSGFDEADFVVTVLTSLCWAALLALLRLLLPMFVLAWRSTGFNFSQCIIATESLLMNTTCNTPVLAVQGL